MSACQSVPAALVASVLLENRNLDGMVGRRGMRRESGPCDLSVIWGSAGCSSSKRGESGWFSMSSAWPLTAPAGSTRRRITRLNILMVLNVRCAVYCLSSRHKVGREEIRVRGYRDAIVFMF